MWVTHDASSSPSHPKHPSCAKTVSHQDEESQIRKALPQLTRRHQILQKRMYEDRLSELQKAPAEDASPPPKRHKANHTAVQVLTMRNGPP